MTQSATVDAVRALARLSRLLERACDDLSLPHYRVLSAIDAGDERASRLATRLALGKPTISAAVDALCRRGLVRRAGSADDQRATDLRITAAGRAALAEAEAAMLAQFEIVLAHVPDAAVTVAEVTRLGAALDVVVEERFASRRP